jgi:serine/threonine-protein kinase
VPRNENLGARSVVELSSSALVEEVEAAAQARDDDATTVLRPKDAPRPVLRQEDDATTVLRREDDATTVLLPGNRAPTLIGSLISERYRVHELIGAGGMGTVYRGEQVHLRKLVAIKVLQPGARSLPQIVARFEREAIAGAHIQHPNVVSAIDFGQLADRSYFLVLEYVEGTPLQDVIASAPLPAGRALRIARQIASALSAVHAKGIVHRDVKPQNVLLSARDQVKLIDFGLAKVNVELLSVESREAAHRGMDLTATGEVVGTLKYLAPEAVRGMDAVDARADLYALGIMLYEMLAGRSPFDASDGKSSFRHRHLEDAPPLRQRAPGLDIRPEVEAIVMRLVQRDPSRRYPTATDVIAAIDGAIAAMERMPGHPRSATSPASRWTSPPIRPWMIVASIVVALLLGVAFLMALVHFFWASSEQ